MTKLKIIQKDGGEPISVSSGALELKIEEPVSSLQNLEEVLSAMPNLETVVCYVTDYGKTDSTKSLHFLRGVKRLKTLMLCSMSCLEDCGALVECERLQSISISRYVTKCFDFDVLPSIDSLRSFSVEMPTNAVLSQVSKAVQLTNLEAAGGFKLLSLKPLAALKDLEQLRLWSGSLASTRGLATFPKLKALDLGYSKLRDATELGVVRGLKKLRLLGNKAVSNLDFLRESDLEFLDLFEIPSLESFKPISRLHRLKEIRSDGKIVDEDLLPFVNHPSLERVALAGRYKSKLKKCRIDSKCVFKVGREILKVTKNGPLVLETAGEAKERLRNMLKAL